MKKAFTLIELLVVIAIIGILATLIVISYGSFKKDARDKDRISKLTQVSAALEQYYLKNGDYPLLEITPPGTTVPQQCYAAVSLSNKTLCFNALITKLINEGYLQERISDSDFYYMVENPPDVAGPYRNDKYLLYFKPERTSNATCHNCLIISPSAKPPSGHPSPDNIYLISTGNVRYCSGVNPNCW